jgi:glycosyltransferase involved in cell wall biosynthesis
MLTKNDVKLILTEHSTNNKRRNNPIFRLVDRWVYKKYQKIIAISKVAYDKLEKHLGDSYSNIRYINNGVDINKFQNALPYKKKFFNLNQNDFIILQVSSFRYPKDQGTIIKALMELSVSTHLFLVGEGPLKQENIDLAKSLAVADRVHFLGVRKDVPRLLKSADVIVLSSHYEGLSLASVEGLASGKPFVSTRVPGLEEVVEGAGILFEYQDSKGLAQIIKRLQNDEDFYNEVARKCQMRALKYNFEDMIDRYIEVYHQIHQQP